VSYPDCYADTATEINAKISGAPDAGAAPHTAIEITH
jgi:hypothetical protein